MGKYLKEYVLWLENQARHLYIIRKDELVEYDFINKRASISIWRVEKGRKVGCRAFSLNQDDLLRIIALYADDESFDDSYKTYARIYRTCFT